MSGAIPLRPIAGTGLAVPELGFGAAPLGNLYRTVDDAAARDALDTALGLGLTYVDTAPSYGFGLSERRVGDALRAFPDAIVSTKAGRLLRPLDTRSDLARERDGFRSPMPFAAAFDYSHDGVLRSHEASLHRLGLAQVDILYVHDIGRQTHGAQHEMRMAELIGGGGLRALRRLREEGSVRAIGIGVNEVAICLELLDRFEIDAILLAGRYTLLEQPALAALLPRCMAAGVSVVIGGPYNSGILAADSLPAAPRYDYAAAPLRVIDRARRLHRICAEHGVSPGAAALQFVLAHPAVASVIPGLASAEEVRETVARARAPIPEALWVQLKAEGLLQPEAPVPSQQKATA